MLPGKVKCHATQVHSNCHFLIEVVDDQFIRLRGPNGMFFVADQDGSFHCNHPNGEHAKWHVEAALVSGMFGNSSDGGYWTLKFHNSSWYLGVSMLGHCEQIEHSHNNRCHFRFDTQFY